MTIEKIGDGGVNIDRGGVKMKVDIDDDRWCVGSRHPGSIKRK